MQSQYDLGAIALTGYASILACWLLIRFHMRVRSRDHTFQLLFGALWHSAFTGSLPDQLMLVKVSFTSL